MKNGDRIRIYSTGLARDADTWFFFQVRRGVLGEVVEMEPLPNTPCARVKLYDRELRAGQELLVPYEMIELAPGYATPVDA